MKLQVQSIHFDADAKLLAYIQEKIDKLDTFFDRIIDGQVYLKVEQDGKPNNKTVDVKINVPGEILMASEQGVSTFEEGVDLCSDNLKRQVKRYKEKMRAHQ